MTKFFRKSYHLCFWFSLPGHGWYHTCTNQWRDVLPFFIHDCFQLLFAGGVVALPSAFKHSQSFLLFCWIQDLPNQVTLDLCDFVCLGHCKVGLLLSCQISITILSFFHALYIYIYGTSMSSPLHFVHYAAIYEHTSTSVFHSYHYAATVTVQQSMLHMLNPISVCYQYSSRLFTYSLTKVCLAVLWASDLLRDAVHRRWLYTMSCTLADQLLKHQL